MLPVISSSRCQLPPFINQSTINDQSASFSSVLAQVMHCNRVSLTAAGKSNQQCRASKKPSQSLRSSTPRHGRSEPRCGCCLAWSYKSFPALSVQGYPQKRWWFYWRSISRVGQDCLLSLFAWFRQALRAPARDLIATVGRMGLQSTRRL